MIKAQLLSNREKGTGRLGKLLGLINRYFITN